MYDARDDPPVDAGMTEWDWKRLARATARAYKRYIEIPGNLEKLEARAAIIRERREERERIRAAAAGAET